MIGCGIGLGVSGFVMSNSPRPVLDLDWATLKAIAASTGPTPSFSRASAGGAFAGSGTFTSYGVNTARFNHFYNGSSWLSRGLLMEAQRTNYCTRSEDFTNAAWVNNASTDTANQGVFIDGNTVMDLLTDTAANDEHKWRQTVAGVSGGASEYISASCFIKAGTRTVAYMAFDNSFAFTGKYVKARFNLSAGVATGDYNVYACGMEDCGNGIYRCWMSATTAASGDVRFDIGLQNADTIGGNVYAGDGAGTALFCGGQLAQGRYPSSYIANTAGSTTTRSADVCQITSTDFSNLWNASQGTIVIEGVCPCLGTLGLLSINDGTANERIDIYTSGTDPKMTVVDGGATQADIDGGTLTGGTAFKIGIRYQANNFAMSVNGGAEVTDVSGTLPTVTQMQFGTDQAGNYLNGTISRVRYWNTALSLPGLTA